ncbi:GNAT family N-acetyltransferase [Marininema halotolerans]|uniref:Ribosomal protein S18 acetylase RimI n=1 Tax=Marininema halotolerans TaxID=1155944 RepID=A0A1I6NTQ4_9BACL|nr:GNAT family N-acetyltransferase [Marininema halotolerans]SFS31228.1 Ribosomal protein S18 acetylase RimI [Marininema halotolerans]
MNESKIEIRKLTPLDAVSFRHLMLEGCRTSATDVGMLADEWGDENPLPSLVEKFHHVWSEPDHFILGAWLEGKLLGTLGFSRGNRVMSQHYAILWAMYVDKNYRGRGIAHALLTEIIYASRKMEGLECLRLKVRSTNERACHIYRTAGFKEVGTEPKVMKLGNEYIDQTWMVCELRDKYKTSSIADEVITGKIR